MCLCKLGYSSFQSSAGPSDVRVIGDLYAEIRRDSSMPFAERESVISRIRSVLPPGTGNGTPLANLAGGIAGAIIADFAAKYFGMSWKGRAMAAVAGFGIGRHLASAVFGYNPTPGWTQFS